MTSGVIVGGWEYVYAAYALTALILIGYAVSVVVRHRQELARRAREQAFDRPSP
jgi:heme exporter protein D